MTDVYHQLDRSDVEVETRTDGSVAITTQGGEEGLAVLNKREALMVAAIIIQTLAEAIDD